MRLICTAHCGKDEYEQIKEQLEEILELQLTTFGTTITAVYEPERDEPMGQVNDTINQIAKIIEPVEQHGISIVAGIRA